MARLQLNALISLPGIKLPFAQSVWNNMAHKGKIRIGCSGFHYKHWVGRFYPEGMKQKEWFGYYQKFFDTVELNNSFYRLPSIEMFKGWREKAPKGFLYSVKANRYMTHIKKLNDVEDSLELFMTNTSELQEKLGPILFQLPPGWKFNEERLSRFLDILPKNYRFTFEFRNHTWYNDRVYTLLHEHNVAFCIYELQYHLSPLEVTADFVYIRLHGPERKYTGSYSEDALEEWGEHLKTWAGDGKDVYIYFDNDTEAHAPFNAIRLKEIVQGQKVHNPVGTV